MFWWLIVGAAIGVLGVANAILSQLKGTAAAEGQRWQAEYQQAKEEVERCNQELEAAVYRAQSVVNFHQLVELHFEAMQAADSAYDLLWDTRGSLAAIGQAIMTAGEQRDRLIAERDYCYIPFRSQQLTQEIDALRDMRTHLFRDQATLQEQRNGLQQLVEDLNLRTHDLKITIRDSCGARGYDWYERLERRTEGRKVGVYTTGDIPQTGWVKWYSSAKAYGFIISDDDGQEIYVNQNTLVNVHRLYQGDCVQFFVRYRNDGNPYALDVVRI